MEDTGLVFLTLVLGIIYVSFDVGVLANGVHFEDRLATRFFIERRPLKITCIAVVDNEDTIDITRSVQLPPDFKINTRRDKMEDGKVLMTVTASKESAEPSDADNYLCSLSGKSGSMELAYQYLEMIPMYTRGANVTEGHETSISCDPGSNSEPQITWFKGGVSLQDLASLKGRVEYSKDNKTVTFTDAKPSDSGLYTCRIDFTPFDAGQVFLENVTLQAKPYIEKLDNLVSVTNTSIVLKCPAAGYPPPQVFWFRGDDVIEKSPNLTMTPFNGLSTGQLNINNATEADFGQYSCTAENNLGKAAMNFDVQDPNKINNGGARPSSRTSSAMLEILLCLSFLVLGSWLTT